MPKCIKGWMNLRASRPTECATARSGIISAGIEEVRRLWDDEALEAARQHITLRFLLSEFQLSAFLSTMRRRIHEP
jgi:hypothetical protein